MQEDPIKSPEYTEIELLYRSKLIQEMSSARDQREKSHDEFDGQTYSEWWESNMKAGSSYIPPKANKEDVRVVTGTTKEKKNSLLSSLLNYNLEPDIEAYDPDNRLVAELGETMQDLIKKSRQLEQPAYEVKRPLIYDEFLTQGTVFVEDVWREFSIPQRELNKFNWNGKIAVKDVDWTEKIDKVVKYCDTQIICGLNVYLGNVKQFYIELQPYIFVRRVITRAEAQALYGNWERWENVPKIINSAVESGDSVPFNNWTLESIENGLVEEVKYYNKWENNFMIMLNGVMMFPVRLDKKRRFKTFPLAAINGECEYPIAKGDNEPISSFFAYSKSTPSKTKVDQQLFDEMLKAVILKTRKSFQPPMANNTGKVLSKNIFHPATIHNGIDPNKLQPIGDNQGVTNAEFGAIQFIKEIIDGKTVSPTFEGQAMKGQQTAREIVELKQQSMMKLGLSILGVVNLEKKLAKLRLKNILRYWTEPMEADIEGVKGQLKHMAITVDSTYENGESGEKIIEFNTQVPDPQQILAEEDLSQKITGKKMRKVVLNPDDLRTIDYKWHIEIIPTEKVTSDLNRVLFEEFLAKTLSIFAPLGKVPNVDYLAERYAILSKEDPDKVFSQPKQMAAQQMNQGMPGPQGDMSQMAAQLMPGATPKPSINTLA